MDVIEEYYGRRAFVLYSLFAKVPDKRAWPRRIFITFSVILLSWGTLIQVLRIVNSRFRREVLIELLPSIAASGGTLAYIPYVMIATTEKYKVLLSMILDDLTEERSEEENEIKRKCAKDARAFTNVFTLVLALALCGGSVSGFVPCLLNILIPLNETREKQLFLVGEFFVDQRKYFYYIYFLEWCVVVVVCIVIGASENMAIVIGQHACSLGAIVGHRLENLTKYSDSLELQDKASYERLVARRLESSIRFAFLIAAFYDIPLTLVMAGMFTALTVSLVQLTDPKLTNTRVVFFTMVQFFQLFILSYLGQCGIDVSERVAVQAYNADWHICTPNARRLLQLVILRSSKPCMVVASSVYTLCMENFMMMMQTMTSCYMVLRQTQ